MDSATMAKRLRCTKDALKLLLGVHPLTLQPQGFWRNLVPRQWGYNVLDKLQDAGLITRVPGGGIMAVPPMTKAALEDERVILSLLWPGSYKAPAVPGTAAEEPEPGPDVFNDPDFSLARATAPPTPTLAPPPQIEGVQRPPPGASPEVVQEWIFTLLHAQTENLIYIRESVDRLLSLWEEPKK
jgi:hypothetical protein